MQSTTPSPPKLQDFSQRAIQGHVIRQGLTHWLTLYPPALGVPLGFAAYLFNTRLLYLGLLGGLTVGLGSAIVNIFFRGETLSASYLQQLTEGSQAQKVQTLEGLRRSLQQAQRITGAEAYAKQSLEQLERMQAKFDQLGSLLATRFQHGELSYGRFLGAAEQVYLGSLDTLQRIIVLLESVGGIDLDYIDKQLASIKEPTNEADRKERETLIRRSKLRCEQLERVNALLTVNEEAMTALEETMVAVAAMSTNTALAKGDFETAIAQLQQVAVRARQY
jgi:hypothetical protein